MSIVQHAIEHAELGIGALKLPWSQRPDASKFPGRAGLFTLSDGSVLRCISDGSMWVPISGVLKQSATPVNTGPVPAGKVGTQIQLASVVLPGGLLGPNGMMQITSLWTVSGTAGNKNHFVLCGGATLFNPTRGSGATDAYQGLTQVRNRGVHNVQAFTQGWAGPVYGGLGTGVATGAIDTSVDQVISLTGLCSAAGDSVQLEAYQILVFPAA